MKPVEEESEVRVDDVEQESLAIGINGLQAIEKEIQDTLNFVTVSFPESNQKDLMFKQLGEKIPSILNRVMDHLEKVNNFALERLDNISTRIEELDHQLNLFPPKLHYAKTEYSFHQFQRKYSPAVQPIAGKYVKKCKIDLQLTDFTSKEKKDLYETVSKVNFSFPNFCHVLKNVGIPLTFVDESELFIAPTLKPKSNMKRPSLQSINQITKKEDEQQH
ncbi:hypothetical protein ABK040_000239 [Willaertia magna]